MLWYSKITKKNYYYGTSVKIDTKMINMPNREAVENGRSMTKDCLRRKPFSTELTSNWSSTA